MDLHHGDNEKLTHDQMMMASFHKLVFVNGVLGVLFNIPLIILIIFRSRPELGTYKYLMLLFALFNVFYPFLHMFVNPGLVIYKRAYIMIGDPGLPFEVAHYSILMWCTLFGMSTCLITFHFVYRYFAVCRPNWLRLYTEPKGIALLVTIFLLDGVMWFALFGTGGRNVQRYSEATHEMLLSRFGIDNHKTATIGELYVKDYIWNNGTDGPLIPVAVFCGAMVCFNLLFTIAIMIFCSYQIITTLRMKKSQMSPKSRRMQVELFRALVAQTIVPIIADFIPCLSTHISGFLGLYMGDYSHFVILLVSSLPFLDALCMTYFIRDYRTAIINVFLRRAHVMDVTEADDTVHTTDVMQTTENGSSHVNQ